VTPASVRAEIHFGDALIELKTLNKRNEKNNDTVKRAFALDHEKHLNSAFLQRQRMR
jgi:hypothetical protein